MISANRAGVIGQPAPIIPYTDTYKHILPPITPMLFGALEELAYKVRMGEGEMGLNCTEVFFHLDLEQRFRERFPCFTEVEEIWLAVDLEAFLNGGEE